MKLKVGTRIRITTDWSDHYKTYSPHVRAIHSIQVKEGVLEKTKDYDPVGTFRLKVEGQKHICVVAFERLVKLENLDDDTVQVFDKHVEVKEDIKQWKVEGSKGKIYTVTKRGDLWDCDCTGFGFRKTCKHVNEKKEMLLA